jgi:Icc-related predicted phosphoesterase
MSSITTILQCGDFGFWPKFFNFNNPKLIKNKNVKIYWCDGNHEDFDSIKQIENIEIFPNIFYMERGSILRLKDGRKVLFIGGALSIDKHLRTPGRDWFPEELISQKDICVLPDEKIDIVISHTAPKEFILNDYHEDYVKDPTRDALSYVLNKYHPKLWYFGHMHTYKQSIYNGCKWTCLSDIGGSERWWIPLDEE